MNSTPQETAQLREILLTAPESWTTRTLAIGLSLVLVGTVLFLVRRRTLREEYTPIWLFAAFAITVISVWREGLYALTRAIGAWTPSSTLFFFGQLFLAAICLNYAVRLSQLTLHVKNLSQEITLLTARLREQEGPKEPSRDLC
jgi:hypothetical protein